VIAPHLQGLTTMMVQGGHGPVWHLLEQTWLQPSRGFKHVDVQFGIGSEQEVRVRSELSGKDEA
jgi:hypothetical protein